MSEFNINHQSIKTFPSPTAYLRCHLLHSAYPVSCHLLRFAHPVSCHLLHSDGKFFVYLQQNTPPHIDKRILETILTDQAEELVQKQTLRFCRRKEEDISHEGFDIAVRPVYDYVLTD